MTYYIVFKRKGSKKWLGAIPSKKGVSRTELLNVIRKHLRSGFVGKVATKTQVAAILKRQKSTPKRKLKRKK